MLSFASPEKESYYFIYYAVIVKQKNYKRSRNYYSPHTTHTHTHLWHAGGEEDTYKYISHYTHTHRKQKYLRDCVCCTATALPAQGSLRKIYSDPLQNWH
jgi:hypothetical protein